MERYFRQEIIQEIGTAGQEKLRRAKVLVIGAGGLGSPVLTYLAAAGVGNLYVTDYDVVSMTNLNRQFLHSAKDIGRSKTTSAKEFIHSVNDEVVVYQRDGKITSKNVDEAIKGMDVVISCVDNIPLRMILNRACVLSGTPLVEGAISGFYGFVLVIKDGSPCLNCIGYEKSIIETPVPVLGTTAGVCGTLQANECIKILTGAGECITGRMLTYDGLEGGFEDVAIKVSKDCEVHKALGLRRGRKEVQK
jgi:adenylyltransferase/sulfurtransferase